jgi:hypothetical protein
MTCLAPCPACGRHVAVDAAACPFCSAPLPESFRRDHVCQRSPGRLSRAALVAAGAALLGAEACWSGSAAYGVAVVEDASAGRPAADGGATGGSDGSASAAVDGAPPGDGGGAGSR